MTKVIFVYERTGLTREASLDVAARAGTGRLGFIRQKTKQAGRRLVIEAHDQEAYDYGPGLRRHAPHGS